MVKKHTTPDPCKWENYLITCIKEDLAFDNALDDDVIMYTYGVFISPNLKNLDKEYY